MFGDTFQGDRGGLTLLEGHVETIAAAPVWVRLLGPTMQNSFKYRSKRPHELRSMSPATPKKCVLLGVIIIPCCVKPFHAQRSTFLVSRKDMDPICEALVGPVM